jgi:hypothetical protein
MSDFDSVLPEGSILFFADSRGIFIPQHFAQQIYRDSVTGVTDEDWQILLVGPRPDNEWYWEAWAAVLDNATVTDLSSGEKYSLYQDGDLWLIPNSGE